ncbi:ATP12 family chaperone protein [Notoacmeibacter ruber]|uniref:ATPase n=1 Tax=Notoacmeibacter ruber TaxID=2670375 RepID=A0A3L7JBL6_9HYPH|nr:ATP12 family protein [Notoacmeibacter ruber]RLQ87834.1 ATPase [Notoacmeibacter ruber]
MRDQLESIEQGSRQLDTDPTQKAREQMRRPLPKRFYKEVTVEEADDVSAYAILLDGRTVKTPGRKVLAFPTRALAELIAAEFASQKDVLDPAAMPAFRLANSAVEAVADNAEAVAGDLVRFAGSDLLCYRAEGPAGLVANQQEKWDPLLAWICEETGGAFITTGGIVYAEQPEEALAGFARYVGRYRDAFQLAAMHSMTTLTGSVFLAVAVAEGRITPEDAWTAAHVDEDWNIAQWGEDFEAKRMREARWTEMKAAAELFHAVRAS